MRLVSTVELIAIRERVHNAMAPFEGPVKPEHFDELKKADVDFKNWYEAWDEAFSRKYENAGNHLKHSTNTLSHFLNSFLPPEPASPATSC